MLPFVQVTPEAAAAAAANKALGGGLEGPAAMAAARAAALGARAAREGYGKLGGVSEHIKALREHVTLPLKVRLCLPTMLASVYSEQHKSDNTA